MMSTKLPIVARVPGRWPLVVAVLAPAAQAASRRSSSAARSSRPTPSTTTPRAWSSSQDGGLLAAWYSGSGERKADDVVIEGAWLAQGEDGVGAQVPDGRHARLSGLQPGPVRRARRHRSGCSGRPSSTTAGKGPS